MWAQPPCCCCCWKPVCSCCSGWYRARRTSSACRGAYRPQHRNATATSPSPCHHRGARPARRVEPRCLRVVAERGGRWWQCARWQQRTELSLEVRQALQAQGSGHKDLLVCNLHRVLAEDCDLAECLHEIGEAWLALIQCAPRHGGFRQELHNGRPFGGGSDWRRLLVRLRAANRRIVLGSLVCLLGPAVVKTLPASLQTFAESQQAFLCIFTSRIKYTFWVHAA